MRLFLMRHADTEAIGQNSDSLRELTQKGLQEAMQAAEFLKDFIVDKILVSYVKRTMQTSNIILEQIETPEIETVTELYGENKQEALELLLMQEKVNHNILVIGHNPLIYQLALSLTNPEAELYEQLVQTSMPTARIVVIDFPKVNNWDQIKKIKGEIVDIFTPKD